MPEFIAHIIQKEKQPVTQAVSEHSRQTAKYAGERLKSIGLEHFGILGGLIHDAGKTRDAFQKYIQDSATESGTVKRGSVNHTFAGCRYLLEQFHQADENGLAMLTSELLAYAVGAHHGQFDCIDSHHQSGFEHRLAKEGIGYQESVQNFLKQVASPAEIAALFEQAREELRAVCDKINNLVEDAQDPEADGLFYYGLLARCILSAVMDADRTDTAEFMKECTYPKPLEGATLAALWQNCLAFMERKLGEFPREEPIQIARQSISDQCAAFASHPDGIYRLNVPTGGGKTLSALRYALKHALFFRKSRIFFISSLLTILDQNAAVIRAYLPPDVRILEHHSNVIRPKDREERIEWEMLTEQYGAECIITTLVQFLNTLFSGKTACIRRVQALFNSVIVIDEVQTVPDHLLTLFNLALNFLANICHATVILCSATQPAFAYAAHPLLSSQEELVPFDRKLWSVFRRTEIKDAGRYRLDAIPDFAWEIAQNVQSLLLVCNTKQEAVFLYEQLVAKGGTCFHLSAGMCMAHRRKVLESLQVALDKKQRIICISTQVIEAGVDISFNCVIRLLAGLDNIVQSAGRCNRNAETPEAVPVYVVRCEDERLTHLADIQRSQKASEMLLNAFSKDPQRFGGDLASDAAIQFYYQALYAGMADGFQGDYIPRLRCTLFTLLSRNELYLQGADATGGYILNQAFKTAGDAFTVFDQDTVDVLVPYGKGQEISNRLFEISQQYAVDFEELEKLLEEAKAYTVSLYQYQLDRLLQCGGIEELFQGRIRVLLNGFYDDSVGFVLNQGNGNLWEV